MDLLNVESKTSQEAVTWNLTVKYLNELGEVEYYKTETVKFINEMRIRIDYFGNITYN